MRGGFGRRRAAIGAVLAVTALAVSCGGEDEGSSGAAGGQSRDQNPPPSAVHVEAVDNSFEPQTLKIPTGRPVSVHLENTGSSQHTFTVPALNVSVTLEPGADEIVKLDVPNRETEFICEFHGSGGMTGTIVPQ